MDDAPVIARPSAAVAEEPCRAKLFMHGGSQAVRLPKAFRFEGAEVTVRKEGEAVILEPAAAKRPPTREEMDAFWRRIDELGAGASWDYPQRDRSAAREVGL